MRFKAHGELSGSDGCNYEGGRYALGDRGRLVAVQGVGTLIYCRGAPTGSWVTRAVRAAFDGPTLVLLGAPGRVIAKLRAAQEGQPTASAER